MKASDKHQEQEALDLLFFEYLEEELPAAEAEALEQRLAHDPVLQDELESWKRSYIEEDFYDTAPLEARLEEKLFSENKHHGKFSFFTSLNVVVLTLMTTMLSFMLITDKSEERILVVPEKSEPAAIDEIATPKAAELVPALPEKNEKSGDAAAIVGEQYPEIEEEKPEAAESGSKQQTAEEESADRHQLPIRLVQSMDILISNIDEMALDVEVKKVWVPKRASQPNISRRQQRMIQKNKKKAMRERQAREFMKGNIPYVVPLNSQNF